MIVPPKKKKKNININNILIIIKIGRLSNNISTFYLAHTITLTAHSILSINIIYVSTSSIYDYDVTYNKLLLNIKEFSPL